MLEAGTRADPGLHQESALSKGECGSSRWAEAQHVRGLQAFPEINVFQNYFLLTVKWKS